MKTFFTFTLLACWFCVQPVKAERSGPSDGGGTNIKIFEDELTDLAKFRERYGNKQYLIDARRFRLKGQTVPIYSQIKPLLDRMIYFYPNMEFALTTAFQKPWIVVNAEFTPRNANEKKVVAQTEEAVFVSLPWLRTANVETLKLVWVHEAFRNLALRFNHHLKSSEKWNAPFKVSSKESLSQSKLREEKAAAFLLQREALTMKAMDQIAEELTPIAYAAFPVSVMDKTLQELMQKIRTEIFEGAYEEYLGKRKLIGSRREIYTKLTSFRPSVMIFRACNGITASSKLKSHKDLGQVADNVFEMVRTSPDFMVERFEP